MEEKGERGGEKRSSGKAVEKVRRRRRREARSIPSKTKTQTFGFGARRGSGRNRLGELELFFGRARRRNTSFLR